MEQRLINRKFNNRVKTSYRNRYLFTKIKHVKTVYIIFVSID